MEIRYSEFTECSITFTPTRIERETLLVALRAMRSKYEDPENLQVFDYFIEKVEVELFHADQ